MNNESLAVDELEKCFDDVLGQMGKQFTSHEFILKIAHLHQKEYVAGLAAYTEGGKPFRDLHHALVRRLKTLKGTSLTLKESNYPSRDIFGTASYSGLWRKL